MEKKITICLFGIFDPGYERNRILYSGLSANGIDVVLCQADKGKLGKYISLARQYFKIRKKVDLVLVAFPGYQAMILAKILSKKPIIFDSFLSIYDAEVCDRKNLNAESFKARYYWLLDWLSCALADKILLDAQAHIDYYVKTFGLEAKKFLRVFLGSDIKKDGGQTEGDNSDPEYLTVHFHSRAHPMQGAEHVVESAKILKDEKIKFNLAGDKVCKLRPEGNYPNMNFFPTMPYDDLIGLLKKSQVCLGIFGDNDKANKVIPNKVYLGLAAGKAVISADTPAIRELFYDRENILLCRAADPSNLAEKILELRNNRELRLKISANGGRLAEEELAPKDVTRELSQLIKIYADK